MSNDLNEPDVEEMRDAAEKIVADLVIAYMDALNTFPESEVPDIMHDHMRSAHQQAFDKVLGWHSDYFYVVEWQKYR